MTQKDSKFSRNAEIDERYFHFFSGHHWQDISRNKGHKEVRGNDDIVF